MISISEYSSELGKVLVNAITQLKNTRIYSSVLNVKHFIFNHLDNILKKKLPLRMVKSRNLKDKQERLKKIKMRMKKKSKMVIRK